MKHYWKPAYYTKKEIISLDNHLLLNAYYKAAIDETIAHNSRGKIPAQLTKQIEWMREELETRLKK